MRKMFDILTTVEMQIKTTMRCHFTLLKILKRLEITNPGPDVGNKDLNVKTKMFLLLFSTEECLFEIREGNS